MAASDGTGTNGPLGQLGPVGQAPPHNIHHIIIIHRRRLGSTPTTASAHPAATTTPRRHADTRDSCTRPSLRPHYHTMRPRAPAPRDHQHGPRNMDIGIIHLNPRASALRDTRTRTPLKLTRTTAAHTTAVPLLSPPTTALPIPIQYLIPEATCEPTSTEAKTAIFFARR